MLFVSTGRVRVDMVFSERGEASKVEPCVQDNAWPTDCKFIFLTMKFQKDDLINKWHFEILLPQCWCLLAISLWCISMELLFWITNLRGNFWQMNAITNNYRKVGKMLASSFVCSVLNWFAQLNSFSRCPATRPVRSHIYQTFEDGIFSGCIWISQINAVF